MKKLMMFAAAMTIVGSAFAEVAAYDYKATVKNVNMKKTTVRLTGNSTSTTVYIKFIQSSSLYGYLINSCDNCGTVADDGEGFLVVANKADTAKQPKILPADLTVKWWNPKINATKTYEAEGYLFAGKGKADYPFASVAAAGVYEFGAPIAEGGGSTRFLFGTYNDYEFDSTGTPVAFFDTWLDAAGFGKALTDSTDGGCGVGSSCTALSSLSGSVIGGLFICHPNGYPLSVIQPYEGFLCLAWIGTTDVISGTWSIKRNTKLAPVALTTAEAAITLGDTETDAYVNGAAKAIRAGFSFIDTATGAARQNGLVNAAFAAEYELP
jgi:hypothetical protein